MESTDRIFVYKMTTDNGGAPCVQSGLLSLAICKPKIRCKANPGDWIVGLGGKNLGSGIVYVAKVKEFVGAEYYRHRTYSLRPDCIYHFRDGKLKRKESAAYHKDPINMTTDVGADPDYHNARVLLSDDFRYFGQQREPLPDSLHPFATSIGRGHRVYHSPAIREALEDLIAAAWEKHASRKQIGEPHKAPDPSVCCSTDEGIAQCDSVKPNTRI